MSVTVVNDYFFKPDGDIEEGKAAADELVRYFKEDVAGCELSLWLESQENPAHHFHITVFDTAETLEQVKQSKAIERFVARLFPQIDHSTYVAPVCDVWLADGAGVEPVQQD